MGQAEGQSSTPRLRIAVISDQGSTGGAGVSAARLSRSLRSAGHRTALVYRADFWADPECATELIPIRHTYRWAGRAWTLHRNAATRKLAQASWTQSIGRALGSFRPDVISLHNLHSAEWDIEVVQTALAHAPIVWTLHDLWPLTGGCALPDECHRFAATCNRACPQAGQAPAPPRGMIAAAHRRRKRLFGSQQPLVLVAPSRWVEAVAAEGGSMTGLVRRIPHGLDLTLFRPHEPTAARSLLQLPNDGLVTLLTSGHSLRVRRKGLWDLAESLARVPHEVRLLVLGEAGQVAWPRNVHVVYLGRVLGDRLLPVFYGAADGVVVASHVETFGLVVQEAMACARPVLAYPVGGVPEMVVDSKTGWLAAAPTCDDLTRALQRALSNRAGWAQMGSHGRRVAEARYSAGRQRARYEALFRGLLQGETPSQAALDGVLPGGD